MHMKNTIGISPVDKQKKSKGRSWKLSEEMERDIL